MIVNFEADEAELESAAMDELADLFAELLRASLRGQHYVLIERRACDWVLRNVALSGREKAQLSFLKQEYTQRGALLRTSPVILTVGISAAGLQRVSSTRFEIGHKALLRGNYLDKPVLIVEHIETDGTFIGEVLQSMRRTHPIRDFAYDLRHGGGSTVVDCFDAELKNKRITVCMVDSDRLSPAIGHSPTVKALFATAELGIYVGGIFPTVCREMENHLPLSVIEARNLCPTYPDFEKLRALAGRLVGTEEHATWWWYFDVKEGVSGEALQSKSGLKESVRIWLKNTYGSPTEEFSDVNYAGFGPNIIKQFLQNGPAMMDFANHMKQDFWKENFLPFFQSIAWFLVAERSRSAI